MTMHILQAGEPHRGYDVYEADATTVMYFPAARRVEIVSDALHIFDVEGNVLGIYPIHSYTCCLRTPAEETEDGDDDAAASAG